MVQLDLQKKKISTKEPPKTAAAMRKSQKAKQKENRAKDVGSTVRRQG